MRVLHDAIRFQARWITVRENHVWVRDALDAEEFFEQDSALVVCFGEGDGGGAEAFEGHRVLGLGL